MSNNRYTGLLSDIFTESGTPAHFYWQVTQSLLVIISCISMLLENYEPYQTGYAGFIVVLELVTVCLLTIDYLGNLYYAEERSRYVFSFWGLVDLISILPFFLLMLNPTSAVVVKSLRALRFLRLLLLWKLARTSF